MTVILSPTKSIFYVKEVYDPQEIISSVRKCLFGVNFVFVHLEVDMVMVAVALDSCQRQNRQRDRRLTTTYYDRKPRNHKPHGRIEETKSPGYCPCS